MASSEETMETSFFGEAPFLIPETWKWCYFSDVVDIATNLVDPKDYQDYFQIAPDYIEKGTGVLKPCNTVGANKIISKNHLFHKGQIIYSKIRPALRKAVIAPFDGLCSADMYPLNSLLNPHYLLFLILSDYFTRKAVEKSAREKMPKINQKDLGNILIPVPPVEEQQRIVDHVNELMPMIAEYEQMENQLVALKERFPGDLRDAVLQAAMSGKLTDQREDDTSPAECIALAGDSLEESIDGRRVKKKSIFSITEKDIPFELPEKWEWVRLGAVCIVGRGGSPRPIKDYITTEPDGINWIKIGDTEQNGKYIYSTAEKIKPEGASKSRLVHEGDFLLTNSMSFGRPYILKTEGCIHDGWLVISQPVEVFDQDYLYWLLSSQYAYKQFAGKAGGGVVKNLNSDKVANSIFPVPPLEEQQRIVDRLNAILPLCDGLAEET